MSTRINQVLRRTNKLDWFGNSAHDNSESEGLGAPCRLDLMPCTARAIYPELRSYDQHHVDNTIVSKTQQWYLHHVTVKSSQ
jgi:hypothetical protein